MLTITTITTKQPKENYSNGESDFNKRNTPEQVEWWGRGAATLGLSEAIANRLGKPDYWIQRYTKLALGLNNFKFS